MTLGVVIGKFNPFHRGHDHLIGEAKARVDRLVVLVCARPDQSVSGSFRAAWIREEHPDVDVREVADDLPEAPEPWAERTLAILGEHPDLVFTAEDYGDRYAELMGARHQRSTRNAFPISGTELRADLGRHWAMLTPPAKAHFARRVCVVGAESTGTTTLAESLARHYRTVWAPEWGRWYWEGRRHLPDADTWDAAEFVRIARGQQGLEDALARRANRLVVCDTDALATFLWHRRFRDCDDAEVEHLAESRTYDLHLLTAPDVPFVQDGTREGEHIRETMHGWFLEELETRGRPYLLVSGPHEERMAKAMDAVDRLLTFPALR